MNSNSPKKKLFKSVASAAFLILCAQALQASANDAFLVKNGKPHAEIVIADKPQRTTLLAAHELQTYLEKISAARLNIVNKPSGKAPVRVFVGRSSYTDELGITNKGLNHGAYRIVSGDDWIVLSGDDTDFTPIEPWPRGYADIRSGKMQKAWNDITGANWGYPHSQLHKHYSGPNSLSGTADDQPVSKEGHVHVWTYDERGSFNAVCGFLRDLGVRWYMPGELGEIVPQMTSISLPDIDRTVRPDFPLRFMNFRPGVYGRDVMMWGFRLGVRQPYGRQAAHGLRTMTDNEKTLKDHPDWFALYGGKRHNDPNTKNNQLCYSNQELFRQAVRFARAQFDHYDMDVVSIMPPDGYTAICQCELCKGKESPELGYRGTLSNYVWDFVNRVAKETGKSHPDKKISNCAYGVYTEPPSNIDQLEPNVQVIIVGGRRPLASDRGELRRLRAGWQQKTDNPIEIFENYPFTGRGFYLPAYFPRLLGESINETKGQSRGEDIWITMDFTENAVGFNHFLLYFTARMYWGGKDQDPAALFDEYVDSFYGPAAARMRLFFSYCEQNWREMETDGEIANRALELFATAKNEVAPASVYSRRIQLIDNYLNGLRNKAKQLAQRRGAVPKLRLVSGADRRGEIVVDGKLDDGPWVNIPTASVGSLRELQTGTLPTYGTRFMAEWIGNDLYFAIRCQEHPGEKPNVSTEKDGDPAIWYGDAVEIQLATDSHSYYQIAVNPAAALIDLDRGAPRNRWFDWSSNPEVATQIADDHWTVEIRIPVTQDANDPLHQVVGRKPTQSLPWHINVCRQRIRETGSEYSAFSPTGSSSFHQPMKFAHFYAGNSHKFPADPTVSDFIIESKKAHELTRARNWSKALAAYRDLADGEVTTSQKSHALAHAAACARSLKDFDQGDELAKQIPLDSVAKTVRMQNLLSQRKHDAIIEQFGSEDFASWPFWQIGAGAFARGKAYLYTKAGREAESDLQTALIYSPDARIRTSILAHIGSNRETNLGDDDGALQAYRQALESKTRIGAAEEFRCVQSAARILSRQQKFDQALETLGRANVGKLSGFWRHSILLTLGETLAAAGRTDEARESFQQVADDETASDAHRLQSIESIERLSKQGSTP